MSIETTAYELIKKRLLTGNLEVNQYHSEASLSKEMNMSRSPVRYALKQLEYDGLITYHKNKGVKVHRASTKEIMECTEIVFLFIQQVIQHASKGTISIDFDTLEDLIKEGYHQRKASSIYEYMYIINKVYLCLISSLNNKTMLTTAKRLSQRMMASSIYNRMDSYRSVFEAKRVYTIQQLDDLVKSLKKTDYKQSNDIFDSFQTYTKKQFITTGSLI